MFISKLPCLYVKRFELRKETGLYKYKCIIIIIIIIRIIRIIIIIIIIIIMCEMCKGGQHEMLC